jgi:AraC family transcriptional activator of pobA
VEYLLADIVHAHYTGKKDKKEESVIVGKLKKLLNAENCKLEVSEAAKRLGFSRGHLNLSFKKETGISVKQFIDKERFIKARKHLLYSDMNLSEIAEELEFSDPFAFSKFFKRMSGKSPRDFLREIRN